MQRFHWRKAWDSERLKRAKKGFASLRDLPDLIRSRTRWRWLVLGAVVLYLAWTGARNLSLWECAQCHGPPVAVLGYSYKHLPFWVTVDFKDRPQAEITISVGGATDGVRFALGGVSSCRATSATGDAQQELTLYASALNPYFPLQAVPELRNSELKRVALSSDQSYPITCILKSPSERVSYDSHVIRFVKSLNAIGSPMTLSQSDTYRIDQPGIESVRFDDTFGIVSVTKEAPLYSAVFGSRAAIPGPDKLKQRLVTSLEWTDKDDTHSHEFYILLLGALAGGGFACWLEAIRSLFGGPLVKSVSISRPDGR